MAETDTDTRKNNTEELKKLNKALRDAAREKKASKADQYDASSLRTYLKEQTIGKIDLKRFLPRELQTTLGVISDIRGIFKAKSLKKKLFAGDTEMDEIDDIEETPRSKPPKVSGKESSGDLLEKISDQNEKSHVYLDDILGELDSQTLSLQFIGDLLAKQLEISEIDKLNLLEDKRESERKSNRVVSPVEKTNTENAEKQTGFLGSILDFFTGAGGLAQILGLAGGGSLLAGIGAALGPIALVLGGVALAGTIAYLLAKIVGEFEDLIDIQNSTKKIIEDQANLTEKRKENQQTLMQAEETREDYAFRVQDNQEKIRERLTSLNETTPDVKLRVTDPKTGQTTSATPAEALKIFSEENVSSSLTNEERTAARVRALERGGGGIGIVERVEGGWFSKGNDDEIRNRYFEMTITENERETYRSAVKKREDHSKKVAAAAIRSGSSGMGMGGMSVPSPSYTQEEQRLLDLSENTERTVKLASVYTAAINLYNNNLAVREQLVSNGVPYGEFDPTNQEHLKAINAVSKISERIDETPAGLSNTVMYSPTIGGPPSTAENLTPAVSSPDLATPTTDSGTNITNNNRQGDKIVTNNSTTVQTIPERPVDPYLRGTAMELGFG